MTDQISIEGLDKAKVLAALYNASRPQGLGFMKYDPAPMEVEEAQDILDDGQIGFDYLKGRVMKIDLSGSSISPWGYDRDNGVGSVLNIVSALRRDEPEDGITVSAMHSAGKQNAIRAVRESLNEESTVDGGSIKLGLKDVAEVLGPKIDEAED